MSKCPSTEETDTSDNRNGVHSFKYYREYKENSIYKLERWYYNGTFKQKLKLKQNKIKWTALKVYKFYEGWKSFWFNNIVMISNTVQEYNKHSINT